MDINRRASGRSSPRPRNGRSAEGWERAPGNRDVPRPRGLPAVPADSAARSGRPAVAGARPVRPVLRTFVADAVHTALPVRLRAEPGRPEGPAHLGVDHPRPPGVRPDP